jgi:pyridinium-3,5-bisthiocarboxylic acid mononucleotide nickel chelatase
VSRTLWLDCRAGAAGDMLLAAIVDAGAERDDIRAALDGLGLSGWSWSWEVTQRCGLRSLRLQVALEEQSSHRSWADIRRLLQEAKLSDRARRDSLAVFQRLAEVEAHIHGCSPEEVVFHEVGALDSIVDIVGVVLAIELLDVQRVVVSPLGVGAGFVQCAHGRIPLPAPATLKLVQGWQVHPVGGQGERLTPTAAALISVLGEPGELPSMTVKGSGYGAGSRDDEALPNVVRAVVGETARVATSERLIHLSANIDDMPAEQLAFIQQQLLAMGALDVWLSPVVMKKGRPGTVLEFLVKPQDAETLVDWVLAKSSSLGVRRVEVLRDALERWIETVETSLGPIRMKVGGRDGEVWHCAPEYEDCATLARTTGKPLAEVFRIATRTWEDQREE